MKKLFSLAISFAFVIAIPVNLTAQRSETKSRVSAPFAGSVQKERRETTFGPAVAYSDGTMTLVEWSMLAERENFGFNLQRLGAKGWEGVEDSFVGGSGLIYVSEVVTGEKYNHIVADGTVGTIYRIESLSTSGSRLFSAPFASVQVDNLAGFSGFHSADRFRNARSTSGVSMTTAPSLPKEVRAEVEANALTPNPEGHRWVVSQPGLRLGVTKEGFYRVTRSELENAGFDVNSDPSHWQLYLEGNQQSIIVEPSGQYIEFYGRGIDTPETNNRGYFLVVGTVAGKRITSRVARPDVSTVRSRSYQHRFVLRERLNYFNQIRNGAGQNFFGRPILSGQAATIPFQLSEIDGESLTANISVRTQGFSPGLHSVSVTLNGQSVGTVSGAGQLNVVQSFNIPVAWLQNGENSLVLSAVGPSPDTNLFDTLTVDFMRRHVVEDGQLDFYTLGNRGTTLSGLSSAAVRLIDTTYEGDPIEVVGLNPMESDGSFIVQIPAARPKTYHAFEPSQLRSVADIRPIIVDSIGTPQQGSQLVIIAHPDLVADANQWAAYREAQGVTVKVINVNDIYDEFGVGVLSSASIKSFLQFAYTNWNIVPGYVLLIGDASFDSRNYLGSGFWNMVPSPIINTIFTETASDEFLADFDSDGLAEISVGRIPARTSSRVQIAFEKTVRWEQNLVEPLSRGAFFAYDLPNGYDFQAMSNRLRNRLPSEMSATFVGRTSNDDPVPQANLVSALNAGPFIVNYAGHGTTGAWENPTFFSVFNVTCSNGATQCVNNLNSESIYTMLTCLNGFFHGATTDSLGEALLFAEDKGSVATWASTGLTTADVQEVMGQRFFQKIGEGSIPRMGDLIKDAKAVIPGGMDVRLSWALIGDPMLKVR